MEDQVKILIVEDVPTDAELAMREVKKSLTSSTFNVVDNETDFLDALACFEPDLIISDYNLPCFDGLTALKLTQKYAPIVPFIITTGTQNEDIAVECMKAGATDYVIKENFKRLGLAVIQALEKKKVLIEKKQMETKLAESESKYRTIFENIQDIYYETALDGTILEVSPSVATISYTREELIGTNILQYYANPEERATLLQLLIQEGCVTDYEVTFNEKDGTWGTFSITARKVINEKDGNYKITGLMRNITERAKNKQELIIAKEKAEEMNRLKSFFLANMSHELRTPLSGILGFSELLSTISTDTETQEMVHLINTSGKRLLNTLNSILDLSRIEANRTEIHWHAIDFTRFVFDRIKHFESAAKAKHIPLNYNNKHHEMTFDTDTNMLEHVIDALLDNAIKFTDDGEVEVRVEKLVQDNKKWVTVRVIDTGIGIDRANLNIIFEPFRQASEGYSRAYEGTGLGLTIAKKFVELLGGEVSVESTSDKGTTFLLMLPDNSSTTESDESTELVSDSCNQTESNPEDFLILPKLLLVDDDEITRVMVRMMLQSSYDIEFAATGKQALLMIDETQYQIILLDINLKENISGIDIVRLLRKSPRYAATPIVAVTAYTMMGDRERFLSEGFTYYLPKPFSKEDLVAMIQTTERML